MSFQCNLCKKKKREFHLGCLECPYKICGTCYATKGLDDILSRTALVDSTWGKVFFNIDFSFSRDCEKIEIVESILTRECPGCGKKGCFIPRTRLRLDLQMKINTVADEIEYLSSYHDPLTKMVCSNRCGRCRMVEFSVKSKHDMDDFWSNPFEHCIELRKHYNFRCLCKDRFLLVGYNSFLRNTLCAEDLRRIAHASRHNAAAISSLEKFGIRVDKDSDFTLNKKILDIHDKFIHFCLSQFCEFITCHSCLATYGLPTSETMKNYMEDCLEHHVASTWETCPKHFQKTYFVSVPCLCCRMPIKLLIQHHPAFRDLFPKTMTELEYCKNMQKLGLFCQFFVKNYLQHIHVFEKHFRYFLSSFPKVTAAEWTILQYHLGNVEIVEECGEGQVPFKFFDGEHEIDMNKVFEDDSFELTVFDLVFNFGIEKVKAIACL